jgi:hypothetical protein
MHGGGFVGGTKEELAGYFKLLASNGFAVVAAATHCWSCTGARRDARDLRWPTKGKTEISSWKNGK